MVAQDKGSVVVWTWSLNATVWDLLDVIDGCPCLCGAGGVGMRDSPSFERAVMEPRDWMQATRTPCPPPSMHSLLQIFYNCADVYIATAPNAEARKAAEVPKAKEVTPVKVLT